MPAPNGSPGRERAQEPLLEAPFQQWDTPGGAPWMRAWRTVTGYLLRFDDLADFEVSRDGSRVYCWPCPSSDAEAVEHIMLNQVQPLALSRQGRLVLHGSAVEVEGGCVAFLGESGIGKSTLAASFAASGHPFLTDDGLLLDWSEGVLHAWPGHPSIRLWDDSEVALLAGRTERAPSARRTPKMRMLASPRLPHGIASRPVRALYLLGKEDSNAVAIHPVAGGQAVMELIRHSFVLDVDQKMLLARHFEAISRMADFGLIYHLDYPCRYDALPDVRAAILSHSCARP